MARNVLLTIVVSLLYYGCASYDHTGFLYPNTVTLNQDALNESWKLTYIPSEPGETLHSFRLDIYDAYNQRVFTSDMYQNDWDIPLHTPPGVFYFIVEYAISSQPEQVKTFWGEFTVIQ